MSSANVPNFPETPEPAIETPKPVTEKSNTGIKPSLVIKPRTKTHLNGRYVDCLTLSRMLKHRRV